MRYLPPDLVGLFLAGAVAACLASPRLYGQIHLGPANPRPDAVQVWREAAARGLSYNESLALYRLRQNSTVPTPLHPRFQAGAGASVYTPPATGRSDVVPFSSDVPVTVHRQPVGKPFENARPEPTAFERYWPLMLEGREDPKTGVIIWYLP